MPSSSRRLRPGLDKARRRIVKPIGRWIVYATAPPMVGMAGWDFQGNYFPRGFHYKADALKLAAEAIRKGGADVKVERGGKR